MNYGMPLSAVHRVLTDKHQSEVSLGTVLDACELRAKSHDAKTLRVKTGEPSFFGRDAGRELHRANAIRIVKASYLISVGDALASREDLPSVEKDKSYGLLEGEFNQQLPARTRIKLSDLTRLQVRIAEIIPPRTAPTASSVGRDSKIAPSSTRLSAEDFQSRKAAPASASSSSSASSPASESPSKGIAPALDKLMSIYGKDKDRRPSWLKELVNLAAKFNPSLIDAAANADQYSALRQIALFEDNEPLITLYLKSDERVQHEIATAYPVEIAGFWLQESS